MKVWIEFPEETRFARQDRDILYTPIYFANEKISAHLRLDKEWQSVHGDDIDEQFTGRVRLIGKASLGFLSLGGEPVNGANMRFALPDLGFKPIYTLEILNVFKRLSLAGLEYEVEDGIRGGRLPFSFSLPTSTLEDLQQLASSLKVISADNISTMGFLKGITPALIVSVQYYLLVDILDKEGQTKGSTKEEVRIFASLSQEQVPTAQHPAVAANPMAKFVTTQVVSLSTSRGRRSSIPLIRRLSRTSTQETNLVTVDVEHAEPFTFIKHSDAAASKVVISLRYSSENATETPPTVFGGIQWLLKTLTTLTLEPIEGESNPEQTDDYFHLRAKLLPSRKLKLKWTDWERLPETDPSRTQWKSTQTIWLLKDITAGMTPSFVTPYLSHTYLLNMQVSLVDNETKLGRGFSSSRQKVELDVPVQVRYDLGLVPSYEVDQSLPEYDHTLPLYQEQEHPHIAEEEEGDDVEGTGDGDGDADGLPDLATLDLSLVTTQSNVQGEFPERQLAHSPRLPTSAEEIDGDRT